MENYKLLVYRAKGDPLLFYHDLTYLNIGTIYVMRTYSRITVICFNSLDVN